MGKKIELTDDQLQELLTVEESVDTDEEVSEEVAGAGTAAKNKKTLKTNKLKKKKVKAEFVEGEDEAEIEVYEDEDVEGDEELSEEETDETDEVVAEETVEGDEELSEEESTDDEVVSEEDIKEEEKEVNIEEDMTALFNGEELSEEFKDKASTIFGAALKSHLNEEVSRLEEEYASKLEESVKSINEELIDKIDDYLAYVVEEWVTENEVAIEQGLRLEIMEDFMGDLKTLFENNNIEVPAEKVDIVAEANEALEAKEAELNEEICRNVELNRQLSDLKKSSILSKVSEGLADSQIEKLEGLAEGVEFEDENSYEEKLTLIRENYFPEDTDVDSDVDETSGDVLVEEKEKEVKLDPMMESYVSVLSRTAKK